MCQPCNQPLWRRLSLVAAVMPAVFLNLHMKLGRHLLLALEMILVGTAISLMFRNRRRPGNSASN